MLKVLHVATQDRGGGGGGFDSAYRLHASMRAAGVDSKMLVWHKASDDEHVTAVEPQRSAMGRVRTLWSKLRRRVLRLRARPSVYFVVDSCSPVHARELSQLLPFRPDVIVAHWIAGFITTIELRDLHRITGAPILWYLIDMAPLTGGCHYAFDCTGYTRSCGDCPQLGAGRGAGDLSHRQWQHKQAALRDTNITPVAATSWLQQQIDACSVFKDKPSALILLGVDADVFQPVDPHSAQALLNLPTQRRIIFFGAHNIHEERKGIRYLVEALHILHDRLAADVGACASVLVVTAGNDGGSGQLKIPFEHRHIGFLRGDRKLAAAYQAAHVFLNASVEDAGPMMINESVMCGTPVVCFDMGVARDIVHSGETGYRATLRDAADMAAGLQHILTLEGPAYQAMRDRCRAEGLQKCHPAAQVRAFENLCADRTAAPA